MAVASNILTNIYNLVDNDGHTRLDNKIRHVQGGTEILSHDLREGMPIGFTLGIPGNDPTSEDNAYLNLMLQTYGLIDLHQTSLIHICRKYSCICDF